MGGSLLLERLLRVGNNMEGVTEAPAGATPLHLAISNAHPGCVRRALTPPTHPHSPPRLFPHLAPFLSLSLCLLPPQLTPLIVPRTRTHKYIFSHTLPRHATPPPPHKTHSHTHTRHGRVLVEASSDVTTMYESRSCLHTALALAAYPKLRADALYIVCTLLQVPCITHVQHWQ